MGFTAVGVQWRIRLTIFPFWSPLEKNWPHGYPSTGPMVSDSTSFFFSLVFPLSSFEGFMIRSPPLEGVAATGFSNGGFLAEHVVASGSGVFTAIAPVGGHIFYKGNSSSTAIFMLVSPLAYQLLLSSHVSHKCFHFSFV